MSHSSPPMESIDIDIVSDMGTNWIRFGYVKCWFRSISVQPTDCFKNVYSTSLTSHLSFPTAPFPTPSPWSHSIPLSLPYGGGKKDWWQQRQWLAVTTTDIHSSATKEIHDNDVKDTATFSFISCFDFFFSYFLLILKVSFIRGRFWWRSPFFYFELMNLY